MQFGCQIITIQSTQLHLKRTHLKEYRQGLIHEDQIYRELVMKLLLVRKSSKVVD